MNDIVRLQQEREAHLAAISKIDKDIEKIILTGETIPDGTLVTITGTVGAFDSDDCSYYVRWDAEHVACSGGWVAASALVVKKEEKV